MVLFKNQVKKAASLILFFGIISQTTFAQNNTLSPYSFVGIGELENGYTARNRALGGLTTPVFSNNHYNFMNPASIGFIDKTIFDFAMRAERGVLTNGTNYRDFNNGNFNYVALGFSVLNRRTRLIADTLYNLDHSIKKIKKPSNLINWGTGFSVSPFSSSGGNFQQLNDSSNSLYVNSALGGLTSLSFNNGLKIGEYFSLGYSFSFVWGQNLKTRLLTFPDSLDIYTLQDERLTELNGFTHNIGVGFIIPFSEKVNISGGASYRLGHSFKTNFSRLVRSYDYDNIGRLALRDTILTTGDEKGSVEIPSFISAGLAFNILEKFSLGAEYSFQNWSNVMGKGWSETFSDYNRFSIGITINPESKPEKSMRRPEIYLGYSSSSLKAVYSNSQGAFLPIMETGMSFGLGLPIVRDVYTMDGKKEKFKSMVYISGEYITRGGITEGRIKEDLYRITIGMSLTDLWFIKRKYR